MRHAITFSQSSFMIICTIVEYSLPLPWSFSWNIISSLHIVFLLCASVGWCDVCTEFTNLICHHWILNVQYLRNNWQLCMSCVYFVKKKKCGLRLKLFLWFDIFSTFRGVHPLIFTYVPYIVIGLHEELANFYRKKQSIAFATGNLITFLVVLFLICLVTTQILTTKNNCCSFIRNQMQWPVC